MAKQTNHKFQEKLLLDEVIKIENEKASKVIEEANKKAQEIINKAHIEAQKIIDQAHKDAELEANLIVEKAISEI